MESHGRGRSAGPAAPSRRERTTCRPSSAALLAEEGVEIVEDGAAGRDARLVVLVGHGDAGDQTLDPGAFLAAELAILQVDIVDDLGDRLQRGVAKEAAGEQDLEAAAVALVGAFGPEHSQAKLARGRDVALGRH